VGLRAVDTHPVFAVEGGVALVDGAFDGAAFSRGAVGNTGPIARVGQLLGIRGRAVCVLVRTVRPLFDRRSDLVAPAGGVRGPLHCRGADVDGAGSSDARRGVAAVVRLWRFGRTGH